MHTAGTQRAAPALTCWAQLRPSEIEQAPDTVKVYLDEILATEAVRQAWAECQAPGRRGARCRRRRWLGERVHDACFPESETLQRRCALRLLTKGTLSMVPSSERVDGVRSTSSAGSSGDAAVAIRRSRTATLIVPDALMRPAVEPPEGSGASHIEAVPREITALFIPPLLDDDHPSASVGDVRRFVSSSRTILSAVVRGTRGATVEQYVRLERLAPPQRKIARALQRHGFDVPLARVEMRIRDEAVAVVLADWLEANPGDRVGAERIARLMQRTDSGGRPVSLERANLLIATINMQLNSQQALPGREHRGRR